MCPGNFLLLRNPHLQCFGQQREHASLIQVLENLFRRYDSITKLVFTRGDNDILSHLVGGGEQLTPKTGRIVENLLHQYGFPTKPVFTGGGNDMMEVDVSTCQRLAQSSSIMTCFSIWMMEGNGSFCQRLVELFRSYSSFSSYHANFARSFYYWTLYCGLTGKHAWVFDPEYTFSSLSLVKKNSCKLEYVHIFREDRSSKPFQEDLVSCSVLKDFNSSQR
jgi:hypothetical protein